MSNFINKIKSEDLYDFLSVCNNDELDPIVEIILNASTNFLSIDETYKENAPNHRAYCKVIADEIRLFGSNSFASVFRGGDGVSYDEVLFDVCEKLDVPCKKNKTIENEENLFDLYNIESKNFEGFSSLSIGKAVQQIAPLLISRVTPIGLALLPIQVASPAFRVTVPCILYIVALRQKKIKEYSLKKDLYTNTSDLKNDEVGKELFFIETNNSKVLAFKEIPTPENQEQWNEKNNEKVSSLTPLIQNIPSIEIAKDVRKTRYMEVFIDGKHKLSKVAGEVDRYRGWCLDGNGKFVEHAELANPSKLNNLVNFGAAFHIVSTVVGQEHLADINAKLDNIKNSLNSISEFLENDRKSKIIGAIDYFEQISETVFSEGCPDYLLSQIEAKEAELINIQNHLIEDITYLNEKKDHSDNDRVGTESLYNELLGCQNKKYSLYNQLLLCLKARACGWQLVSNSNGKELLLKSRKKDILKIADYLEDADALNKSEEVLKFNLSRMSSVFNRNTTLNERKLGIINKNKKTNIFVRNEISSIKEGIVKVENLMEKSNSSTGKILLKLEGDKVVSTSLAY